MDCFPEALKDELARVDTLIQGVFDSDSPLIREVGAFLSLPGGKKIRPALTILAARTCGRPSDENVMQVAAAIELVHVATLLHDDVIDKAATRRGRPSVNARWSDSIAILMADYLFSRAFDLAFATTQPQILRVLCDVTKRMCEGELFQIEKEGQILTREDYFKIIRHKTAYLFSACARLGGMVAQAEEDSIGRLGQYGLNFGMAFQITDDMLDYAADDARWGKELGADVVHGKQTLPLIYTLEVASPRDRSRLLGLLRNGRDFQTVLGQVRKYRGLDHAREVAREFAGRAAQSLEGWTGNGQAKLLRDLCDYVVARSY